MTESVQNHDAAKATDEATASVTVTDSDSGAMVPTHDAAVWRAKATVAKYEGVVTEEQLANGTAPEPYEVIESEFDPLGNLLMYGGVSCLWQSLIGNGSTTAGGNLTYFSNAQAALGVGDSATAEAGTQTDLQAATNKLRKAMAATYPTHTDGTTSAANTITFQSVFATADANYAWAEWGTFNSATAATGRMLNRKVQSFGTKTNAGTWTLTITIQIA